MNTGEIGPGHSVDSFLICIGSLSCGGSNNNFASKMFAQALASTSGNISVIQ
ncbi:hypothetical protein DCAR_0728855 [Daucus carota subsp. sativus]|uniref:Uncharacterized protein n=1 Tax=Daucus carota subsp. sativus TaxID=79200 RepID=A0A164TW52_DAUCS|nr:hypothetical protein DCAR_0728855 [Daucus carota subsp. sativus]